MPIQLREEESGRIVVIQASGKLVKADYAGFVTDFERLLKEQGKLRVLFDMTGLEGWNAGAAWEDVKFDVKHFADITRLAIVGDKRWQHAVAIFFKPFSKAATRYFDHSEMPEARNWLMEA